MLTTTIYPNEHYPNEPLFEAGIEIAAELAASVYVYEPADVAREGVREGIFLALACPEYAAAIVQQAYDDDGDFAAFLELAREWIAAHPVERRG